MAWITLDVEVEVEDVIAKLATKERQELFSDLQSEFGVAASFEFCDFLGAMARGDFVGGLILLRRELKGREAELADRALHHAHCMQSVAT